jgi:DNA-3-methyladenine glycosylase II
MWGRADWNPRRQSSYWWVPALPHLSASSLRHAGGPLSSQQAAQSVRRQSREVRHASHTDRRLCAAADILSVNNVGGRASARQDRGMRLHTTVMTDHPAWTASGPRDLVRPFPLSADGYGIACTDGSNVEWCCPEAAASCPPPEVFALPQSAAWNEPDLALALDSLGAVARFQNPSLWDALGTAIIRQVVRAAHAQQLYRTFCTTYGTSARCGSYQAWLFPSPDTVLALSDNQFAAAGLTFKRTALRAAAAAVTEHEKVWTDLAAADLCTEVQQVPRIGRWTAGAAVADWTNDFATYPYDDLAVRTWLARITSRTWPADARSFSREWHRVAGEHLPQLTLLVLAWGSRYARTST